MSKIEVEVYALSDMNTACRELGDAFLQALDNMEKELARESDRLETIHNDRAREVALCERALMGCLAIVDEHGHSLPCTAEYSALMAARRALKQVEAQIIRFASKKATFSRQASAVRSSIQDAIAQARSDLATHIDTLLYYLRSHPEGIDGMGGSHQSSTYRRARQEMVIRTARGEFDSDMMDFLQPQLINQVNQQAGYFHSPSGYHASHRVRGIHIPENLIWEHRAVNQGRYWEAERLGLTRFTAYG